MRDLLLCAKHLFVGPARSISYSGCVSRHWRICDGGVAVKRGLTQTQAAELLRAASIIAPASRDGFLREVDGHLRGIRRQLPTRMLLPPSSRWWARWSSPRRCCAKTLKRNRSDDHAAKRRVAEKDDLRPPASPSPVSHVVPISKRSHWGEMPPLLAISATCPTLQTRGKCCHTFRLVIDTCGSRRRCRVARTCGLGCRSAGPCW